MTPATQRFDRRLFVKGMAAAGVAALAGGRAEAAGAPAMAIAHSRTSPAEPDGIAEEARRLTRQAVDGIGGMGRFVSRGDVVWVKPNIAWDKRPEQAANTNPDVVAAVVEMCLAAGAARVVVSDHATNSAQRTFPRSGIQAAAVKAGADCTFLDARKFRRMAIRGKALSEWEVYADVVEADKVINVPIVKHHGLCRATLGIKNLMGVVGGARNRFHQDLDNTLADLLAFLEPTLVVVDAVRVLTANGPVGGNVADVARRDTVIASVDHVAADACAATLLGARPEEIGYVVEAAARGLGRIDFESLGPRRIEV
jgi:uncharacterized protein (DUF362 family)